MWRNSNDINDDYLLHSVLVCLQNKVVTEASYIGNGKFIKHGFDSFPSDNNPIVKWRPMLKAPRLS